MRCPCASASRPFRIISPLPAPESPAFADPSWSLWLALGISPGELVCFLAFWAMNVFFIWRGTESIKWMESLAAPFLIVAGLVLLGWAVARVGSLGAILSQGSTFETSDEFWGRSSRASPRTSASGRRFR